MQRTPPRTSLEHQAPNATRRIEGTITVRALRRGYYDEHMKEAGDVFTIRDKKELGSWMQLVKPEESAKPTAKPANQRTANASATATDKGDGKDEPKGTSPNDVL